MHFYVVLSTPKTNTKKQKLNEREEDEKQKKNYDSNLLHSNIQFQSFNQTTH